MALAIDLSIALLSVIAGRTLFKMISAI